MIPSKFRSLSSFRTVSVIFALMMATFFSQVIGLEGRVVVTSRDDEASGVISVQGGRSRSDGSSSSIKSSASSASSSSVSDCTPVTNEVLWLRLNLHTNPVGTWTPRPDRREPRSTAAASSSKRRGRDSRRRRRRELDGWSGDLHILPTTTTRSLNSSSSAAGTHPNRKQRPDAPQHRRHQKHKQKKIQDPKRSGSSSVAGLSPSDPTSMLRSTSWQCRMEQEWKKMEDGTFPAYLQTGRCRQVKCMEGLYECTPKRYSVKLLKRIPNVCYPLPVLGRNSSFEDAWTFVNHNVIVGCECTRKRDVGTYYSSHAPSAEQLGDNS